MSCQCLSLQPRPNVEARLATVRSVSDRADCRTPHSERACTFQVAYAGSCMTRTPPARPVLIIGSPSCRPFLGVTSCRDHLFINRVMRRGVIPGHFLEFHFPGRRYFGTFSRVGVNAISSAEPFGQACPVDRMVRVRLDMDDDWNRRSGGSPCGR